ncbi:MAG: LruC domain-containing protein, partial [Spirochaetales bacterium]|nr:LruC domain-containing protein [Spirochaetales bacterium]
IITLHDEQGNLVYPGRVQSDGSFITILQLPSAPEDMTLTLNADGFASREVIISDMVSYSKIDRHMSILSNPLESRSVTLTDSDGDMIPDIYDAVPNDPNKAFSNSTPSLTVAFEDLFLRAQAGDADYNDFIAKYSITEILNSDNHIVEIQGEVEAVAKMAGYNHLFGIMIDDLPEGTILNVDYIDSSGNSQNSEATINGLADIVLFESTKNAVGMNAGFSIIFDSEAAEDRSELVQVPYNPYLLVFNTGHDIHLIGEDALPGSINPGDNYQDSDGFPWALLVPTDWIHPDESQRIEVHYPRFTLWRESFGAEHSDWYLHYDDPYEPPVEPDPDYPEMVFTSDRGDGDLEIWVWDTDTGFAQLTFNDS